MKVCGKFMNGTEKHGAMNCGELWGSWKEDKVGEMVWIDDEEPTYCDDCSKENRE